MYEVHETGVHGLVFVHPVSGLAQARDYLREQGYTYVTADHRGPVFEHADARWAYIVRAA